MRLFLISFLLVLSVGLAIAYGLVSPGWYEEGVSVIHLAGLKASAIIVLAMLGALARAPFLAVWALLFGAAGDALLAKRTDDGLVQGAVAFLIGHLCYIAVFLPGGIGLRKAAMQPLRALVMLAAIGVAVAGTMLLVPSASPLFTPLAVYTGVLTFMVIAALTLPASRWLAMAGAVLFLVSDGFVAAHVFRPLADPQAAYWMNFAGWMIYWAAQAALCVGALGLRTARA